MPTTYAVARPRSAEARLKKSQCDQEAAQAVSTYRGIAEDQQDQADDVVEYMEVDEAALERRKRDMCTPEVSSVCSEVPPTPPAPRASVSSSNGCPQGVPCRAPLGLPPEVEDVPAGAVDPALVPESRLEQPLPPPYERTSAVAPAAFNDSIIPEEDEDDDAFSTALYSDVVEDEDLYITVPSEWDGEEAGDNSYASSRSGADTPTPVRPHRQPAQVIVIRETNNHHSQSNGNAPRPPEDLPEDRPVPRLSVHCLLCCVPQNKTTTPQLSRTAGCRWLATALVLFFLLVSLILINLANQHTIQKLNSNQTVVY